MTEEPPPRHASPYHLPLSPVMGCDRRTPLSPPWENRPPVILPSFCRVCLSFPSSGLGSRDVIVYVLYQLATFVYVHLSINMAHMRLNGIG